MLPTIDRFKNRLFRDRRDGTLRGRRLGSNGGSMLGLAGGLLHLRLQPPNLVLQTGELRLQCLGPLIKGVRIMFLPPAHESFNGAAIIE